MSFLRTKTELLTRSASDIVILSALRTPITRAHRGLLRNAYPEELLASVLAATRASLPPELLQVDDVTVGVVLSVLGGSKAARMALARAGFDAERTTLRTVNRACASSLEAVAAVAAQIRDGGRSGVEAGIAAGMESMTRNYGSRAIPPDVWPELRGAAAADGGRDREAHPVDWPRDDVGDCLMPMGLTAEIVARRYGISREEQDLLAVESHRRAAAARAGGAFDAEIAPVTTRAPPPAPHDAPSSSSPSSPPPSSPSSAETVTVTRDDGIRPNLTAQTLSDLAPAFLPPHLGATCTAGNSSPLSDGASAVVLASRAHAHAHGVQDRILGRFVAAATAGCPPREMGMGPAVAVPRLLGRLGLDVGDVHRWEVNEAFASQTLGCLRRLGLGYGGGRVNPDGGAIALGHPLGATGARLVATLLHGLRREGRGEVGVVTLCVGTGMGQAALFVAE